MSVQPRLVSSFVSVWIILPLYHQWISPDPRQWSIGAYHVDAVDTVDAATESTCTRYRPCIFYYRRKQSRRADTAITTRSRRDPAPASEAFITLTRGVLSEVEKKWNRTMYAARSLQRGRRTSYSGLPNNMTLNRVVSRWRSFEIFATFWNSPTSNSATLHSLPSPIDKPRFKKST